MVMSGRFRNEISAKQIKEKDDTDVVLVNKTRLYVVMSLAMRGMKDPKKQKEVVKLQRECIGRTKSEREMFIPMTVKEVKDSFGKQLERVPYNTFIITDDLEHMNQVSQQKHRRQQEHRRRQTRYLTGNK